MATWKILNRQFLILLLAVGLIALMIACASAPSKAPATTAAPSSSTTSVTSSTTTSKPPPPPSTTTTTTSTTPAANKYGGTLKFFWNDTSPLMGYPATSPAPGLWYASFCVETLIQTTKQPGVYDPMLATSWTLAPDKKSYTFNLRKGVKYHDGSDFNAAAVKWNIENAIKAKRVEVSKIASVDVIDDYTVKMNLSSWNSLVLDAFCRGAGGVTGMISPTAFQKNGQDWVNQNPIGTGAFMFKEFAQGQYVKYVKNPNYWDKGLPYLDAVEVYAIKDPMTRQAMLLRGEMQGAREVDANSAKNLLDTGKWAVELGSQGNFLISYNSTDPTSVWSKLPMRQALEYAIDKQTLSDSIGLGFTHPSYGVINGIYDIPGNNPGTVQRKYDPAKAAQLVKDAGYPNGLKVPIEMNTKFNDTFLGAIQGYLAKAGITLEVTAYPDAVWSEKQMATPAPSMLRYNRARGGPFTMLQFANTEFATNSGFYLGMKRPDGWDALLEQALQEADAAKMVAIVNQMEQKAYSEVMAVPVFILQDINMWSPSLKNDRGYVAFWGGQMDGGAMRYTYFVK